MRNIRNCEGVTLETGVSACPVDFGHIKAIILVEHGKTLGTTFTPGTFEQMCHADVPDRIYPIKTCVEYAKSGGEPQVSATGYGGNGVTGISPQTDTFTLDKFYDSLAASITKNMNKKFDAYYLDENNLLIGVNTGADALGGIPMSTIYCTPVPHPTSSAKASMTVSLCLEDARKAIENFDYVQLDFNPIDELNGLTPVDLVETSTTGDFIVVEHHGGNDITNTYGSIIATGATQVMSGITAASFADGVIHITAASGSTPKMKKPSILYASDVTGLEFVQTIRRATT